MFRRTSPRLRDRHGRRRGAILLIVLTLLALFAVIGLSFVLYAESEANAARVSKDAVNTDLAPPDTTGAINSFLEQMIYQPDKTESALWGNELARLMYGQPGNTSPYNGVGVYSEMLTFTASGMPNLHRSQIVRFGKHPTNNAFIFPDQTYADPTYDYSTSPTGSLKYVGRNAPYTYADRNNIYVAVQDPATGRIVKPSYHAPSLFGPLAANNLNWYTPEGYFQLLRPRTIDHLLAAEIKYISDPTPSGLGITWPIKSSLTQPEADALARLFTGLDSNAPESFKRAFPFPAPNPEGGPITGDVQNVRGTENQQAFDSVWLDLKLPIITYRGTRRLQPMIAATVLPLDGRVNSNVAGNIAAAGSTHGSNQGFGPAEVSLLKVLPAATVTEMLKQRYGGVTVPPPPGASANYNFHLDGTGTAIYPPTYSMVDFNGDGGGSSPQPTSTPGSFRTSYTYLTPTSVPADGPYGNSDATESNRPPLLFTPFQWNPLTIAGGATAGAGGVFPLADERYLGARYSDKDKNARLGTYLGTYINTPVSKYYSSGTPYHPMNQARSLLTPISNRRAVPGLAPMAIGNTDPNNAGAPALSLASDPVAPFTTLAAPTLTGPRFDLSAGQPFVTNAVGGDITGSPTANAANVRAILQGVDLNRPLADYRDPSTRPAAPGTNWPLSPSTISAGSYQQASNDRQNLARDIFTRLCVAMNARVYFTPASGLILPQWNSTKSRYELTDGTTTWVVTPQEFDALRWVAQLSANIVDATDPDDISTVFQWNSPDATAAGLTAFTPNQRGGLADCVVFGVEKPKLLVNEVYAEVANKPSDYTKTKLDPADRFTIRFFVELLNPSNVEGAGGVDQSARSGGNAPLQFPAGPGVPTAFSSYRIQVYDNGQTVDNELASTTNLNYVLGQPATAVPKLQSSFLGVNCNAADPATDTQLTLLVEPNNGVFQSVPTALPGPPATPRGRKGFCVVGPAVDPLMPEATPTAYMPQTTTPTDPANFMLLKPTPAMPPMPAPPSLDQMEYESAVAPVDPDQIKVKVVDPLNAQQGHAVVLQRLANPYYPENASPYVAANGPYNPYITVDYMAGVEVRDAVRIGLGVGMPAKGDRMPAQNAADNYSLGRAQPYAGFQKLLDTTAMPATRYFQPTATAGTPPLGQTLSVLQNPQPAPATTEPHHTFFRHNSQASPGAAGDPTLILPFREPFQPDRRLVNPLEVLHLSMAPSHLLTRNFATPNGTNVPNFYQQELLTRVRTPVTTDINAKLAATPFYRALEVLSVKPWTYGIPHGGRVPGGINVNALWDDVKPLASPPVPGDSTVFNALLDPQPANLFGQGTISSTPAVPGSPGTPKIFGIWERLRTSRSPTWTSGFGQQWVGATVDEWDPYATLPGPGLDRPFKGFGVGQYNTAPVAPSTVPVGGVVDSPMRLPNYPPIPPPPVAPAVAYYFPNPDTGNANGHGVESTFLRTFGDGQPVFSNPGQADPYFQMEPLRKAFNNLTTVSDNYLVVFTVGFFDIDMPSYQQSPSRVVLRREAYEQVPGDLRTQYTAVIDRSGLAVDTSVPSTPGVTGKISPSLVTSNFTRLPDRTVAGKKYATYRVDFPAYSGDATEIKVLDAPSSSGSLYTVKAGTQVRIGDGPNAFVFTAVNTGATILAGGPPPVPTPVAPFNAGVATVTLDSLVEVDMFGNPILGGVLPNNSAGDPIRLPDNEINPSNTFLIPGNPGRPAGFSPTDPRFRGVVRYFGKMQP